MATISDCAVCVWSWEDHDCPIYCRLCIDLDICEGLMNDLNEADMKDYQPICIKLIYLDRSLKNLCGCPACEKEREGE